MKNLFLFLTLLVLSVNATAQEQEQQKAQDTTKTEKLDEVLVKAIRVKEKAPITHSNLDKKEIAKRNLGQDIPVLLNYLPSVVSSSDAGAGVGYTYLRVRGSDASRINVTINGIPYNDPESQGTFWVNIGDFASSTQSLQLQRGVGTSTNGSGAFGASLNILTDAISEKAGGEISNSFGSFGTRKHTVKFTTGRVNENFEVAGRLSKVDSDGYVDRAFTDLKSYFLQGSYSDGKTLIKAISFGGEEQTYQAWYGLSAEELKEDRRQNFYTYDNETDNYWQNHYQLHWNQKIDNNWSTNLGLNYTKGEGYFEQFKDDTDDISLYDGIVEGSDFNEDGDPITDVIRRRWLDNDFYVLNANVTYKKEKLEIVSGLSVSSYTGDHFGEVIWARQFSDSGNIRDRYYNGDATKNDFSVFSKATFKLSKDLTGFADLQGRFVSYKTYGQNSDGNQFITDVDFNFFNPKFGVTYDLNSKNSFYASYARGNKEPNRDDYENNGASVKHESLSDFELGWRYNGDIVQLSANAYYMLYDNQLVLTGAIDNVGAYLRENVKDSYRLGLEIDANVKISKKFNFNANLALSENKIKDLTIVRDGELRNFGNTTLAFSPSVISGSALTYMPLKNLQLTLLGKYVGSQYLSNTDTEASKIDSYFVSDFNVVYEIKMNKIFKSIVLQGLVNNIFNKEYVDRGYTYLDTWTGPTDREIQGFYPQATINFLLGATLKF